MTIKGPEGKWIEATGGATQNVPTGNSHAQSVADILSGAKTAPELSNNQRMIGTLATLQETMEPTMEHYHTLYGTTFDNISGLISTIENGLADRLEPETIDMRAIFSGLHEPDTETGVCLNTLAANLQEETPLFRGLLSKFMGKSAEEKASMLRFFEWIDSSLITRSDKRWVKNPLKKVLFSDNSASYKEWIIGIFSAFEKDSSWMILLIQSIQEAEAPNTPLPWKSIRTFFPENQDKFEEADQVWLSEFYAKYPDVTLLPALIKVNAEADKAVRQHNELNKKYVLLCSPEGTASEEAKKAAHEFRDSVK